jgi:hypothetical protein
MKETKNNVSGRNDNLGLLARYRRLDTIDMPKYVNMLRQII